jgi:hypothetical protein
LCSPYDIIIFIRNMQKCMLSLMIIVSDPRPHEGEIANAKLKKYKSQST